MLSTLSWGLVCADSSKRPKYGVLEKVPQHELLGYVWVGRTCGIVWLLAQEIKQYKDLIIEILYKNPSVSYASAIDTKAPYASVDAAKIVIDKLFVYKALTYANTEDTKTHTASAKAATKTSKVYTFDITKANAIFDQLLATKIIKLQLGHNIPKPEYLKGKVYCKYPNSFKNATNNCDFQRCHLDLDR